MTLSLAYRGFNYVSYYNGGYVDADSLHDLAASGSNAAGLNLEYGINVNTSTIYIDSNYTDSLTTLGNTITEARNLGLTVMVKPLIDFLDPNKIGPNSVDDWRAYFNPSNPAAFFASYKSMIVSEAQVAQAHGATLLSIGTELDQLTGPQYLSYWTDIISSVRAVFSGKLTYSALWNDDTSPWQGHNGLSAGTGNIATQVSFWSQLDYVGLDVYPPISDLAHPTLADLIAGWTQVPTDAYTLAATGNQSLISYFEGIAAQIGKPLLFTEIGYESATDAALEPAGSSTDVYDPTLQANLYTAFFDAWQTYGNTSLNGVFIWNWDPNTAEVGPTNGANFSPQGLPAADVIKAAYNAAIPPVNHEPAVSDFDGDGHSDALLRKSDGSLWLNTYNGATITGGGPAGSPSTAWDVVATADFNGDGHSDVALRNHTSGQLWFNFYNGATIVSSGPAGSPAVGWDVAGTGDFNGDGKSDILLRNHTSGALWLNLYNGVTIVGSGPAGSPATDWDIAGIGDFDGDGKSDVLLRNHASGQLWINFYDGASIKTSGAAGSPTTDWDVAGLGDFNGDGRADVLLRNHASGTLWVNFYNGVTITGSGPAGSPTTDWDVVRVADYNGDGHSDVMLRNHLDGHLWVNLYDGLNIVGSGAAGSPTTDWQFIGV
jgi:hypothetical protein